MCQHEHTHIHPLDWNNKHAFPKNFSDWNLQSFTGLYALSTNQYQDRKSLTCLAYERTVLFANVYVFQILSKQFPAFNFLFIAAIPFQNWIYKSFRLANYVPLQLLMSKWCNLKANYGFVSMSEVGCPVNWSIFLYHRTRTISFIEREISSWSGVRLAIGNRKSPSTARCQLTSALLYSITCKAKYDIK